LKIFHAHARLTTSFISLQHFMAELTTRFSDLHFIKELLPLRLWDDNDQPGVAGQ
jgi:hypothetical protein